MLFALLFEFVDAVVDAVDVDGVVVDDFEFFLFVFRSSASLSLVVALLVDAADGLDIIEFDIAAEPCTPAPIDPPPPPPAAASAGVSISAPASTTVVPSKPARTFEIACMFLTPRLFCPSPNCNASMKGPFLRKRGETPRGNPLQVGTNSRCNGVSSGCVALL